LKFERSVCVGLNVTTTTKKGHVNFLGEEKCTPREKSVCPRPDKILATCMRKGPRLTLGWGPRMVNPAHGCFLPSLSFSILSSFPFPSFLTPRRGPSNPAKGFEEHC